jgi:hypothetical protein
VAVSGIYADLGRRAETRGGGLVTGVGLAAVLWPSGVRSVVIVAVFVRFVHGGDERLDAGSQSSDLGAQ